jgi:sphinganine C4-monooxygenase
MSSMNSPGIERASAPPIIIFKFWSVFSLNDGQLSALVPVVAYWVLSLTFHLFETLGWFSTYRLHADPDETKKNLAKPGKVLKGVLLQQFLQVSLALIAAGYEGDIPIVEGKFGTTAFFQKLLAGTPFARPYIVMMLHSLYLVLRQLLAFTIIDTYQFLVHYWEHSNKWLYRKIIPFQL